MVVLFLANLRAAAITLTAIPLSLAATVLLRRPDVVQAVMVPGSRPSHLAEVLYGDNGEVTGVAKIRRRQATITRTPAI